MARIQFGETILMVSKCENKRKESLHFHVRLFFAEQEPREFFIDYVQGDLQLMGGMTDEREKEMLIHAIQVLDLAGLLN